ncbi:MAG: flagellar basal body P-ring formation chaperone FlgA [Proteobacteria bacterium]|nr:flagellar basal body P-ring formation chaperone FlgA [Pseudomonadota bacterium]
MKRLIPVIACLVAFSLTQAALGQVRLRSQANIDSDAVTLGDLFTGVGDLAALEIGPAPAPGGSAVYNADHLIAIARSHDLTWRPAGSVSRAVVRRGGEMVDRTEVIELLRREFRQAGAAGRIDIRLNRLGHDVLRPQQGDALRIDELSYDSNGGPFSAYLQSDSTTGASQGWLLRGRVDFVARVPVASRDIRKGQKITSADFKWMELSLRLLASDIVEHPDQMVGLAAKRNLRQNQPIKQSNLRIPIMIAKGSMVTITLNSGGISLIGTGRALEDGSLGESIRIMNVQSKRSLDASVIAPDHVRATLTRQIAVAVDK